MIYDCVFLDDQFGFAKPSGWLWSDREAEEFIHVPTPEMYNATEDYQVEVNGQMIWASDIDKHLLMEEV